jgi:hypothetical protein
VIKFYGYKEGEYIKGLQIVDMTPRNVNHQGLYFAWSTILMRRPWVGRMTALVLGMGMAIGRVAVIEGGDTGEAGMTSEIEYASYFVYNLAATAT